MKLAILLVSRNRPDLVRAMVAQLENLVTIPYDLFVVECGTDLDKLTPHTSAWYPDPDFRGKAYGHNVALQMAQLHGRYDYYWVLMNDLVFPVGSDPAKTLIETLERESRMAILSPTNQDGGYPGAAPVKGGTWRAVTTCDYLGFMLKGAALEECGFLNPAFQYCWGAIHELAYRLNTHGWFVAYSDEVSYGHLGGTTYGAKGTNTISREEYQRRAKRFAYDYMRERYGDDWAETFWSAAAPFGVTIDTFAEHKEYWASGFTPDELVARGHARAHGGEGKILVPRPAKTLAPPDAPGLVRVHLGCGPEKRQGWINVDTQASFQPDVVSSVVALPMFPDASVDVIEANHLFEHLTLHDAHRALREWARILKPGGELFLELPDLDACIRILGRHRDEHGYDVGLMGIYGWPVSIEREGVPQLHKWGWTKASLAEALRDAGFAGVDFGPITQTWRVAAKVGRDFRVKATRRLATQRSELPRGKSSETVGSNERLQLFAWPDWRDPRELERLFTAFGAAIARTPNARFVLRFDEAFDGDRDGALTTLATAHARTLGEHTGIDVLFLEGILEREDWERLGRTMTAVARLGSSSREPRQAACLALGLPLVDDAAALTRLCAAPPKATAS